MTTYNLQRNLMQIPILVREMIDPRAHKVAREEHRHRVRVHPWERLLEDLEAPKLALG